MSSICTMKAAQSALRSIASGTHSQVLLKVSFCSRATRNAIANGFVPEDIKYLDVLLPHRAIREKIRWDYQAHYRFPELLCVCRQRADYRTALERGKMGGTRAPVALEERF